MDQSYPKTVIFFVSLSLICLMYKYCYYCRSIATTDIRFLSKLQQTQKLLYYYAATTIKVINDQDQVREANTSF